jgi:hypothetical protein
MGDTNLRQQVFISYASTQADLAMRVAQMLEGRGYTVHYDKKSLEIGSPGPDRRIAELIEQSDLVIFLISPESVSDRSYCHNELRIVQQRWPRAEGHVLPVVIVETDINRIDPYLRSIVLLFEQKGDLAWHTADAAQHMLRKLAASRHENKASMGAAADKPALDEIRAFIQRAEVRLSTMHRVSGAFVSGAGLVVLIPFLLSQSMSAVIDLLIRSARAFLLPPMEPLSVLDLVSLVWIVGFLVSVGLPLYAIYRLLRDLVLFFFVPHGAEEGHRFLPRYAISAISFPGQMSDPTKRLILSATYKPQIFRFGIMTDQRSRNFYTSAAEKESHIKPPGREEWEEDWPGEFVDSNDRKLYNIACGVAGLVDRTLIEEAARLEVSLVRHNIALRGIIIRYAKALIITLWTAIALVVIIALVNAFFANGLREKAISAETARQVALCLSVCFAGWAAVVTRAVRWPVRWLDQLAPPSAVRPSPDPQFVYFEDRVLNWCWLAIGVCFLAAFSVLLRWLSLT